MKPNAYPGVYRHYKGQHYRVIGMGHDANADELHRVVDREFRHAGMVMGTASYPEEVGDRNLVVYIPLYYSKEHGNAAFAVRDFDDFTAMIHMQGGEYDEQMIVFGDPCDMYEHRYNDRRTNRDRCPHGIIVQARFVREPFPPITEI